MNHYKYIAVVLVYRNVVDLNECVKSMQKKITSLKIIVINAFYDNESMEAIRNVAEANNCIFINTENKGYSYGNNIGIGYAREHYSYDYIIISNPDIRIRQFDDSVIDKNMQYGIVAPKIIAASGKHQNPMKASRSRLSEKLIYYGFKNNQKIVFLCGVAINKFNRIICLNKHKYDQDPYPIYAAHGSFVIITKDTIEKIYPVYDENMFLFAEEDVLAFKAEKAGIRIGQFDSIIIDHKEDGSMSLSNISTDGELKKSNMYYFEHYVK